MLCEDFRCSEKKYSPKIQCRDFSSSALKNIPQISGKVKRKMFSIKYRDFSLSETRNVPFTFRNFLQG